MKKTTSVILTLVMAISIFAANIVDPIKTQASTTIKIGDYVQMGKYYDEPILWRCVDIDENGPLMLADRILTIKPFDAKGKHKYLDGTDQAEVRINSGSNLWETSNIRSWLNSTETAGNVTWLDGCPPIASELYTNAYDREKGFIADGNFTQYERDVIKSVTQKSLLNELDVNKLSTGGKALHAFDPNIETVVQNYDDALYHNVIDKIFLLDVKQVNKVYKNGHTLGADYYRAKPTQKAIDNADDYDTKSSMSIADYWYNWTRTPFGSSQGYSTVRITYGDYFCGDSSDISVVNGSMGVRPAFYINESAVNFKSGNGNLSTPYSQDPVYSITYNANSSTNGTVPIGGNYFAGDNVIVAGNTGNLTKKGYHFVGWNTLADGSGVNYTDGIGTFSMDSKNLVLYAQWITSTINIGDYVQMGKYYDQPILWRCVDIDANGPLILADRILTIKPFDAAGKHKYLDGTNQADTIYNERTEEGSNLWETSNIRSWLNSYEKAGAVAWVDGCPPSADKVWSGYNSYANEKGFLAEGNFTASERSAIKSVTQKSLLNNVDANKLSIGGTAIHTLDTNISTVVQNYDTAYYHNVTDKMFLLDVKQIYMVHQNSSILGTNYYIGKPTQKALINSEYNDEGLSIVKYMNNWTRTPRTDDNNAYGVRLIGYDGSIGDYYAKLHVMGVRPAFYINLSTVIFKSGNGEVGTPYVANPTPTYNVTYNANGSISGTAPTGGSYLEGANVIVSGNTSNLTKTDCTFTGWNTKADGTGINYSAGTGTFTMGSADVILYAQFTLTPAPTATPVPIPTKKPVRLTFDCAYLYGYEMGGVGAEDTIKREEAAALLYRLLKQNDKLDGFAKPANATFSDVATNRWSFSAVEYMASIDVFDKVTGKVRPGAEITRGEASKIIAYSMGMQPDNSKATSFTDLTNDNKYYSSIKALVDADILKGYSDNTIKPSGLLTRAEYVTMINRLIGRDSSYSVDSEANPYPDMPNSHWAYKEIMRASFGFSDDGTGKLKIDPAKKLKRSEIDYN